MAKSSQMLMSGPMVMAYLAGLKTQTRRVRGLDEINQNPDEYKFLGMGTLGSGYNSRHIGKFGAFFELPKNLWIAEDKPRREFIPAPYGGGVGDTLWFKETWKMFEDEDGVDFLHYRADDAKIDPTWWSKEDWMGPNPKWHRKNGFEKWQSSMLMPKMCSRFVDIEILNVRVERLQSITREDAKAEGVSHVWEWNKDRDPKYYERGLLNPYVANYSVLWDEINGESLPWDKNPWVWVYEFPKFQAVRS